MEVLGGPVWAVPRGTEGVRIMTQAVADRVPVQVCLAGTGLCESDLADEDAEIWAHQEFTVIGNIIAALGDRPGLGADVGLFSTWGRVGLLGFVFLSSASVREGVQRVFELQALLPSHVRFGLDSDGDADHIVAADGGADHIVADDDDIPVAIRPFVVERDLTGLAAVMVGAGIEFAPAWVETTLDEARADRLSRTWPITAEIRHSQPRNRLVCPPGMLDTPLPQADSNTARTLERQCRRLLRERISRAGVAGQVRSRLMHDDSGFVTMRQVCAELHLDPRTLRRRLDDEAVSFRELAADVRRARAERLLEQPLSIESIARRLGYAETASFTHAFTRWTGRTPTQFRAGLRG